MALTDKKIQGSTPIREFPDKYNGLINDLIGELNNKETKIATLTSRISELENVLATERARIRAEYLAMYNKYVSDLEEQFNAKMNSFETKMSSFERRLTEKFEDEFVKKTDI